MTIKTKNSAKINSIHNTTVFSAWIPNQKHNLEAMHGTRCYFPSTGTAK